MSAVRSKINSDITSALKSGDKTRVAALRFISATLKQKEVDLRRELSDDECIAALTKMAKQRREAIACYEDAKRQDLRDKEQYELDLIASYLPQALDDAELNALIDRALADHAPADIKQMGKIMAALKPQLQGRADMAQVSAKVRDRLTQ